MYWNKTNTNKIFVSNLKADDKLGGLGVLMDLKEAP